MKNKKDDRSDNVDKIQNNINNTIQNIEKSNAAIDKEENKEVKKALEDKNDRRLDALDGMRKEIKDEAIYNDVISGKQKKS
jgi:small acid-soluble spore protein (thioredoxin-like protein)